MADLYGDRDLDRASPGARAPWKVIVAAMLVAVLIAVGAWAIYAVLSDDGVQSPTTDPSPPVETPRP